MKRSAFSSARFLVRVRNDRRGPRFELLDLRGGSLRSFRSAGALARFLARHRGAVTGLR